MRRYYRGCHRAVITCPRQDELGCVTGPMPTGQVIDRPEREALHQELSIIRAHSMPWSSVRMAQPIWTGLGGGLCWNARIRLLVLSGRDKKRLDQGSCVDLHTTAQAEGSCPNTWWRHLHQASSAFGPRTDTCTVRARFFCCVIFMCQRRRFFECLVQESFRGKQQHHHSHGELQS